MHNKAETPSPQRIALILVGSVVAVSTAAIFIRLALREVTPSTGFSLFLAASRMGLAAFFLIPALGGLKKTSARALGYGALAGLCLAVHFASWISSLSYTSIAASVALVTTNPVWVALISWIWFKERPSLRAAMGIVLALLGSLWIGSGAGSPGSNVLLGNSLALLGAISVSGYFLLGREAQRQGLDLATYAALAYGVAALVLIPLPLLWGTSYLDQPPMVYGCILGMALIPQLIGHTGLNWAMRWTSPTLVTLVILFEPVLASLMGYFIFAEVPGIQVVIGGGILLGGVALAADRR